MERTLPCVLGVSSCPSHRAWQMSRRRSAKSTCFHCNPSNSPNRAPVSMAHWNSGRNPGHTPSTIERICSAVHVGFSRRVTAGLCLSLTGDLAMRSLSTANEKTLCKSAKTLRTVFAAAPLSSLLRSKFSTCSGETSTSRKGLIAGRMWSLSPDS